jgi:hypothetical protein
MTERKFLDLHEAIRDNGGAECESLPEFFFPEEPDKKGQQIVVDIAKAVCEPCPMKALCLDYAMSTRVIGIWGGTTPEERYSSS